MATATNPSSEALAASPLVDGDCLYEVVNGQIVETPQMGSYEADLANLLAEVLGPFARANRLGRVWVEMLFRIDPAKNLQRRPDVAFVSHQRWPSSRHIPQEPAWDMVPDLAVEIVSPSNKGGDVIAKMREYFQAGVRRVWVVFPNTFEIYDYESPTVIHVRQLGDELDGAPLLPGFRLSLRSLFEDEPERDPDLRPSALPLTAAAPARDNAG